MQSLSQMTLLDPAMPSRSSCRRCAHYSTTDLSTDGHVLVSQAGDALFLLSRLDLADMDRLWGVWLGILCLPLTQLALAESDRPWKARPWKLCPCCFTAGYLRASRTWRAMLSKLPHSLPQLGSANPVMSSGARPLPRLNSPSMTMPLFHSWLPRA